MESAHDRKNGNPIHTRKLAHALSLEEARSYVWKSNVGMRARLDRWRDKMMSFCAGKTSSDAAAEGLFGVR